MCVSNTTFYIDDKAMMEPIDWLKIERYIFDER